MPYDARRHGPQRIVGPGFHARVHALVCTVPPGFVTSYGDLARALGSAGIARHVGFALAALPAASDVPWWRVVKSSGQLAGAPGSALARQARHLASEGVAVKKRRVVDFASRRFPFAT